MNFETYLQNLLSWFQHFTLLEEESLATPEIPSDLTPYLELLEEIEFYASEGLDPMKSLGDCSETDKIFAQRFLSTRPSERTNGENRDALALCIKIFQEIYKDLAPLPYAEMQRYDELSRLNPQDRTEVEMVELSSLANKIWSMR